MMFLTVVVVIDLFFLWCALLLAVLYMMGACLARIDDGHSTRPMAVAAFPAITIMLGTKPRLYFLLSVPYLPKTIVASCNGTGHPFCRPTLRPFRAAHHTGRPWSPLRMNFTHARGQEVLRGSQSHLPPHCRTPWPFFTIHLSLPAQGVPCNCAEELYAAARTAHAPAQRTTPCISLARTGPSALRLQHVTPSMRSPAFSHRPFGATRARGWTRRDIAPPLAWTSLFERRIPRRG